MQNTVMRIQEVAAQRLGSTYAVPGQYNSLMARSQEIIQRLRISGTSPLSAKDRSLFSLQWVKGPEKNLVDNLGSTIDRLASEFVEVEQGLQEHRLAMSDKVRHLRNYSMGVEKALADLQQQKSQDIAEAKAVPQHMKHRLSWWMRGLIGLPITKKCHTMEKQLWTPAFQAVM